MCENSMKDEKIQEIQTTFFAIKTEKVETGHTICVESEVYNLQKNLLYEFHIIDQEDECRRLNCCLEMMLAKQLGEPMEGESYCFFLALDEETELYHVQSYIKTSDKPILREYLERAGRNPDNKVLGAFSGMTEEQKESLKRQLDSPEYAQNERDERPAPIFNTESELRCKYELAKTHYSPKSREYIEGKFAVLQKSSDSKEKHHAKECLKYFLTINTGVQKGFSFSTASLRKEISASLYGMENVTERIIEILMAARRSGNSNCRILLVGSPGTGKTEMVHAVSRGINRPIVTIEGSAMRSGLDLIGEDKIYDKSEPGAATLQFFRAGTTDVVLLIDEVDKMGKDARDGNCFNALLSLLEGYDTYLEGCLDLSSTLVFATANSLYGIPDAVVNRFEVIHIPDFDFERKIKISEEYCVPKLLRKYHLSEDELRINKDVIEIVARQYCSDAGMRDTLKYLEMIFQKVLANNAEGLVSVNTENIKEYLAVKPDKTNLRVLYNNQYQYYSEEERREIEGMFSTMASPAADSKERMTIRRKLEYHIYMNPYEENREKVDIESFYRTLEESHFGMEAVKRQIIRSYYSEKQPNFRFLFYGPAGTGKTSLINAVGKALDIPVVRINCNGLYDVSVLKGTPDLYGNGDCGAVIRGMSKKRTRRVLIHLDEIDKGLKHGGAENIESVLMELLDDGRIWHDTFLDFPINMDSVSFIATCNSLNEISPILLDRFRLIPVMGYEPCEKKQIASDYILPRLIRRSGYDNLRIHMDDTAAEYLVDCAPGRGVRGLEHCLRTAVEALIEEYCSSGKEELYISKCLLEKEIGSAVEKEDECPCKDTKAVGIAKGIGVCNGTGRIMTVEATVLDRNEIVITGSVEGDTRESVLVIRTLVETMTSIHGKGLHIHFGTIGERKCGPSAGLSVFAATYSAYTGLPVPMDVVFTGEVTLKGYVTGVGGVEEKIRGAQKSGCSLICVPKQNYTEKVEELCENSETKVLPIYHVKEVIKHVFGEGEEKDGGVI